MEQEELIKEFDKFFVRLGELCFNIKMVNRGKRPFDFTRKEGQVINPHYFDEINRRYPNTLRGFPMAIERKNCDSVDFFLQENGQVVVEFFNEEMKVEKIITYLSIKELWDRRIELIHFLTKAWKPF